MIGNLMFQTADWYRPTPGKDNTNSGKLGADVLVRSGVPVNLQPASAKEIQFASAFRSMEISHTAFTETTGWQRNDVLSYDGRRFQVVGVRDLIELGRVVALDCLEYRGANQRQ